MIKFDYNLQRFFCKGISVSVALNNEVTVKCPYGMGLDEVEKFLESKSAWIERHLNKNAAFMREYADIFSYKKVYVNGKVLPLVIADKDEITADAVFLKETGNFKRLLLKNFCGDFFDEINELSLVTGLEPESVRINSAKTAWGRCDSKKRIVLNYKLFMVPPELRRYVIIHELCHIAFLNHSPDFWALVGRYDKDWKIHRKQLKNFDFLTVVFT